MRYVVGSADEVRRFAPLPRTVYLVGQTLQEISSAAGAIIVFLESDYLYFSFEALLF